jgi:hypothetical protein
MLQANCLRFHGEESPTPSEPTLLRKLGAHPLSSWARTRGARSKWKETAPFAVILSDARDPTGSSETDRSAKGGVLQPVRRFGITVHGACVSPLAPGLGYPTPPDPSIGLYSSELRVSLGCSAASGCGKEMRTARREPSRHQTRWQQRGSLGILPMHISCETRAVGPPSRVLARSAVHS